MQSYKSDCSFASPAGTSNEEQLAAPISAPGGGDRARDEMDFDANIGFYSGYSSAQIYDYPPATPSSSSVYGSGGTPYYPCSVRSSGYNNVPGAYGFQPGSPPVPPHATYRYGDGDGGDYSIPFVQQQRRQDQWNYEYRQQNIPSFYNNNSHSNNNSSGDVLIPPCGGASAASAQRLQMWNAHNAPASSGFVQHDSGVHSMAHSSAASVMSSIHAASQISGVSSLQDGSTDATVQLTDAQRERFHHIPLQANFRHASPEQIRRTLPDLIPLLNDVHEDEVVCEALRILQRIVRVNTCGDALSGSGTCALALVNGVFNAMRNFRTNMAIIRAAVCTLYYISVIPRYGIDLLIQEIDSTNYKCLDELLNAIRIHELSCFKYAVLILHNLLVEPKISRSVVKHTREVRALAQIVERLTEPNEKFTIIVIDIVRHLIRLDADQKSLFCALKGPSRLIRILETARYGNLLLKTAKLLSSIANYPDAVVDAGAFDKLHVPLGHADKRVVRELLICLRDLSDVSTAGRDLSALLSSLLYIFGNRQAGCQDEAYIQQTIAQSLANLSANNPANKAFLVRHGVIEAALRVLLTTEPLLDRARALKRSGSAQVAFTGQQIEEIQDDVLKLLGYLCSGHALARDAQFEVMRFRPHGDILLQKIARKRVILTRRTLRIICQTSTNDACLDRFRAELIVRTDPKSSWKIVPYIREIAECLQVSAENYTNEIEGIKMSDIVQNCLTILINLCRDNYLLETIVSYLQYFTISVSGLQQMLIPKFVLRFDYSRSKALAFCEALARHAQISFLFSHDSEMMELLNAQLAPNALPNNASHARRCLDWIYKYSSQNYYTQNLMPPPPLSGSFQYVNYGGPLNSDYWSAYGESQRRDNHRPQQYYGGQQVQRNREVYSGNTQSNLPAEYQLPLPPDCMPLSMLTENQTQLTFSPDESEVSSSDVPINSAPASNSNKGCAGDALGGILGVDDSAMIDDDEFGGAAARCSTPVDASALHATIGTAELNGGSSGVDSFDWNSAEMSASMATVIGDKTKNATKAPIDTEVII